MNINACDISVLVPTYNRPGPLKDCLESIKCQTKLPLEVIIVDASENMESKLVIDSYSNLGFDIQYFRTKPDKIEQRNYGVSKAIGKMIQFSDDDIVFDSKYFENLETYLHQINDDKFGGFIGRIYEEDFLNKNNLTNIKTRLSKIYQKIFLIYPLGNGEIIKSGQHQIVNSNIFQEKIQRIYLMGGVACYFTKVLNGYKFDHRFKGYAMGEDIDYSLNIGLKYNYYYIPWAILHHKHLGIRKRTSNEIVYDRILLLRIFYHKYRKSYKLSYFAHVWALIGLFFYLVVIKSNISALNLALKAIFRTIR